MFSDIYGLYLVQPYFCEFKYTWCDLILASIAQGQSLEENNVSKNPMSSVLCIPNKFV